MLRCRYFGRSNSLGRPGLGLRLIERIGIVAFVGKQPFTAFTRATTVARWNADFVQQWLGIADVTGLTAREEKAQRCTVGVAEHMDFDRQATATAA